MQCKDIDEKPILRLLAKNPGQWHMWWEPDEQNTFLSILPAFPEEARPHQKLLLAKMTGLMKRGLVDGCACGCRGDFYITEKGIEYLKENDK